MEIIKLKSQNCEIPLLYEFDKSLPVVKFKLVFTASGAISAKPAVANLCANILNHGTLSLGVNEFARLLEIRAIEMEADCGYETFVFTINCLKEHFSYAISQLISLLKEPNFSDLTLEKIKTRLKGELLDLQSDFDYVASYELNGLLYENTPLKTPILGEIEDIEAANLNDVHEFFGTLSLSNLYIVLGGESEIPDFSELLACFPAGRKQNLPQISPSNLARTKFLKKESHQAFIYFGAPYYVKDEEKYLANVANFILGGSGFGSRMMEEIRVKNGLAYSVYSRQKISKIARSFGGYLQTKNENYQKALDLVRNLIDEFVHRGAIKSELEAAKSFILGNVVMQMETNFKRMAIRENEFYWGLEFGEFERNLERIKSLKLETLNDFIKAHSEISQLSVAAVGNDV